SVVSIRVCGTGPKEGSVLRRIGLSGGLDRRASFMVLIHGAYTAANLLAGTFLSIFLWRASHDLVPIAIYSGLSALMIPAAFVANGWVWRGLGAGASIRLGLFGNGFVYLLILVLGSATPEWVVVLGLLRGLADGFTGSLMGLVLTILTYLVLKNEQQVGNFNGLMGLFGVAISLGLAAFMKPRHRTACALVGGALLVLSTLLLPLYLTAWALIGFGLLRAIGGPLHGNALAPMALQVIDRDPTPKAMRYDYIVHQELCLGVGLVLSIGCFLLLAAPVDQMLLA